jgi:hypothetical protein
MVVKDVNGHVKNLCHSKHDVSLNSKNTDERTVVDSIINTEDSDGTWVNSGFTEEC